MFFRWLKVLLVGLLPLQVMAANNVAQLPDFVKLVEANSAAVVNISTTYKVPASGHPWGNQEDMPEGAPEGVPPEFDEFFRRFFGDEGGMPGVPEDAKSLGSGFILSKDGYVLTNHHVVANADEILVRLSDKRELRAEVIGSDKYTDIALLKVKADNLPVVKIGSAEQSKVGSWVLAIGSPFGFDHSVTAGIISAKGRSLPNANYVPFIQTDVAINPGNSGGPLFDMDGKVIGINSQIYSRTGGFMGLSFAIPIEVAMDVVQQIKDKGEVSRGWLGVMIQEVTVDLAESFGMKKPVGALVSQVIEDAPAAKAGVKAGDVIVQFNGQDIVDSSDLPPLVGRVGIGSKAKLKVLREGQTKMLDVVIEKLPDQEPKPAATSRKLNVDNRIGVEVVDLDKAEYAKLKRGVRVERLATNGIGYQAGLRGGDVILQIDKQNVKNAADFRERIAKLPAGRMVPMLVQRQGNDQFLVLKMPKE
jgi:serine protease Do